MKKISAFLGLAVFVLVLVACKKGEGGHCYLNKDCKDTLVCSNDKHECATLETANANCAASDDCKERGSCHANATVGAEEIVICIAKSEDDCKQAACAKDGCKFVASAKACQK